MARYFLDTKTNKFHKIETYEPITYIFTGCKSTFQLHGDIISELAVHAYYRYLKNQEAFQLLELLEYSEDMQEQAKYINRLNELGGNNTIQLQLIHEH